MNTPTFSRTGTRLTTLALASLTLLGTHAVFAQTTDGTNFKPEVLQRFSGATGNTLGARPYAAPVLSRDGLALLGTTLGGGPGYSIYSLEQGAAYRLALSGNAYSAQILDVAYGHQFTSSVLDSAGTLWAGGAQATSSANSGVFFSLTADGQATLAAAPDNTQIAVTAFSPKGQTAIDSQNNIYFSSGALVASCTSANADTSNTLWRRTPAGAIERVVRFCDYLEQGGVDTRNNPIYRHVKGGLPAALIWSETDQALYGLTQVAATGVDPSLPSTDNGGKAVGTLIRISKAALDAGITAADGDKIEVLHTFAQDRDGVPTVLATLVSADTRASGLVEDGEWLYGTTYTSSSSATAAGGTVWRVHKGTAGSFTVVHHFHADSSQDNTAQADGSNPMGTLVRGADGNIYGTTSRDARSLSGAVATGAGTLFRIRVGSAADRSDDAYEVVHRFDAESEGGRPVGLSAGAITNGMQKLYGANRFGGASGNAMGTAATSTQGNGTLFSVDIPVPSVNFETPLAISGGSTYTVGDTVRLSWSTVRATSCEAGGDNGQVWTGSQQTGAEGLPVVLTQAGRNSFTLTCVDANGQSASSTATLDVLAAPETGGGQTEADQDGGGGGPVSPWLLALLVPLAGLIRWRARRA